MVVSLCQVSDVATEYLNVRLSGITSKLSRSMDFALPQDSIPAYDSWSCLFASTWFLKAGRVGVQGTLFTLEFPSFAEFRFFPLNSLPFTEQWRFLSRVRRGWSCNLPVIPSTTLKLYRLPV